MSDLEKRLRILERVVSGSIHPDCADPEVVEFVRQTVQDRMGDGELTLKQEMPSRLWKASHPEVETNGIDSKPVVAIRHLWLKWLWGQASSGNVEPI
jgi:hypothetical protein